MKAHRFDTLVYASIIVLLLLSAYNALKTLELSNEFDVKIAEVKAKSVPPKIELVVLNAACPECSSVETIIADLKSHDLNIVKEESLEYGSQAAAKLIKSYGIKRLPAIVLEGETQDITIRGFARKGNSLMFDSVQPPYQDALSGEIRGLVSVIMLEDKECEHCFDISVAIEALKQNNVFVAEEKIMDVRDGETQEIIEKMSIERVPVLLLSQDIEVYPTMLQSLRQLNISPRQGFYVIESPAPYIDLNTGKLRGIVNITYLTDQNCEECYNVEIHRQVLRRFGIRIEEEQTFDAASAKGKDLIQKYSIVKIPTIIVQGDLEAYPAFERLWLQGLGSKEKGNVYIFRYPRALGNVIYKDLNLNKIIGKAESEFVVEGTEFEFKPSSIAVAKGDTVRIRFKNNGRIGHALVIEGIDAATNVVSPGEEEVIEFTAEKQGVFSFYCSVPGHREAGMEGTIEIE